MDPCPKCGKLFKRVATHLPHCKEQPYDVPKYSSNVKTAVNSNRQTNDLTPCPKCGKLFKHVASHLPHCKEQPYDVPKYSSNVKTAVNSNRQTNDLTPCPKCGKLFQRIASHLHHCKEQPDDVPKYSSNVKTVDNSNTQSKDLTPCPKCGKLFQRVATHLRHCKEQPDVKTVDNSNIRTNDLTLCPNCGKLFQRVATHLRHCKEQPDVKTVDNSNTQTNDLTVYHILDKVFQCVATHLPHCKEQPVDVPTYSSNVETAVNSNSQTIDLTPCPEHDIPYQPVAMFLPDYEEESGDGLEYSSNVKTFDNFYTNTYLTPDQSCNELLKYVETTKEQDDDVPENEAEAINNYDTFKTTIAMKKDDISKAAYLLNGLKRQLKTNLEQSTSFQWGISHSGCYYSKLKIHSPNEFDFMMYPKKIKCHIDEEGLPVGFCRVVVDNKTELPLELTELLQEGDILQPKDYKEYVFKVFKDMVENDTDLECLNDSFDGPAYTVNYLGRYDIDWVPTLMIEGWPDHIQWSSNWLSEIDIKGTHFNVVGKESFLDVFGPSELWRLSFSKQEQTIFTKFINRNKTDRKIVLKILKGILNEFKEEEESIKTLCSYFLMNFCLNLYEDIPNDCDWCKELELVNILKAIEMLIQCLSEGVITHYFYKNNLLDNVPKMECERFKRKLEHYKNQWSFQEF